VRGFSDKFAQDYWRGAFVDLLFVSRIE